MLVIGLTGTLAGGKSTAAAMFADEGAAIFNADAAVHALYEGAAVRPIEAAFPGTTVKGSVDREKLRTRVVGDPAALARLEGIVHPLVHDAENGFRARAAAAGRRILVLDIPLLLETGGEGRVDVVVVVTAPEEVRRARVLHRAGMSETRFAALSARQLSDADKRRRAHFIIDTSGAFDATRKQVRDVLRALAGMAAGG